MAACRLGWTAVALAAIGCSLGASAQSPRPAKPNLDDTPPIVQRMFRAQESLRFSGVRIVEFKRDGKRIKTEEIVSKDGPRYRIEYPRGSVFAGQIIVENEKERLHFYPDTNEIKSLPRRKDETLMRLGRFIGQHGRRKYRWDTEPGERIADRATQKVSVRDARGNAIMKLWIDEANGMLLKRELLDPVGSPVAMFEYRRVDFSPTFRPSDFEINRVGARRVTVSDELERLAEKLRIPARRLPDSNDLKLESVRELMNGEGMEQLYVGQGRRLSLFILKSSIDAGRLAKRTGGRLSSTSWVSGGLTYVLLGNLSPAELERLANRLK